MTDQRVANRDLFEMRQSPKKRQVAQVEVVPGVDPEAKRMRQLRGLRIFLKAPLGAGGRGLEFTRERFSVQLDTIAADRLRPADRIGDRIDEHADANTEFLDATHHARE